MRPVRCAFRKLRTTRFLVHGCGLSTGFLHARSGCAPEPERTPDLERATTKVAFAKTAGQGLAGPGRYSWPVRCAFRKLRTTRFLVRGCGLSPGFLHARSGCAPEPEKTPNLKLPIPTAEHVQWWYYVRMNGATQTLNELLAPVTAVLGIDDAWIVVACVAAFLFLLFFVLFVSRCVKIGRLKRKLEDLEEQVTVLSNINRLRPIGSQDTEAGSSVVYPSVTGTIGQSASLTGEVNPYATVSDAGAKESETSFDDAWRSENTQFFEKCETGVVFAGDTGQGRQLTDVIFGGGTSRKEATVAQEQADGFGQKAAGEPLDSAEEDKLAHIRGLDIDTQNAGSASEQASTTRNRGLSGRIPHL